MVRPKNNVPSGSFFVNRPFERWRPSLTGSLVARLRGLCLAGILCASGCALGPSSPDSAGSKNTGGTASVTFVTPERFVDLHLAGQSDESSRSAVLARFQSVIEQEAKRRLPAEITLEVRITDVDLAGWIPPGSLHEFRVISDSRPARIELQYLLTKSASPSAPSSEPDRTQATSVVLTSAGWIHTAAQASSDPLAIEVDLLLEWVRKVGISYAKRLSPER